MTIARAKRAAECRGMFFDGVKKWRNSCVGVAYEILTPCGRGFFQADTVRAIYRKILEFPKI